ncbi:class I SAM-dependent methyltransferase [Bacillus tianshenii]|nr:class I SAM-dependent methyltransferase [Bacillus tianshenii]
MFFQLAVLIFCLMITISIVIDAMRNGITPTPSSATAVSAIINYLKRQNTTHKTIYDLGSGWGNLVFPIARIFPSASVIGIENALIPYLYCKGRNALARKHIHFSYKNMYQADLSDTDYIICYIHRRGMEKLKAQFQQQLKPGCIIISHFFTIPGWTPTETIELHDWQRTKIYIYHYKRSVEN